MTTLCNGWYYAECHKKAVYAECRYAECLCTEPRGAMKLSITAVSIAITN